MKLRHRTGELRAVNGETVHIREDGPAHGKTILLLHGFCGSLHSFDRLVPFLAERHRLIRLDLRGHGCTGGRGGLDTRSQAAMVTAVLDSFDVTEVTAAGHSYGADIALATAERSTRVSKIVIIGQGPDYGCARFPRATWLLGAPLLGALLHRLAPAALVRLAARSAFAPGFLPDPAMDDRAQTVLDHAATAPKLARLVLATRRKALAARPLDAQAKELGLAVLAVLGRHDPYYDCATTAARYRAVGAHVEIVERSGHSPMLEQPETTARAIEDFALKHVQGSTAALTRGRRSP